MPFKSEAQRRKFYSDPKLRKLAPEFEAATLKGSLPERVGDPSQQIRAAAVSHMQKRRK